jgi:hypothetical protein
MACCAFAVFVLMQVTAPFVWLRERLFGRRAVAANTAVMWTFEQEGMVPARSARHIARVRKGFVIAFALELVVLAGAVQLTLRTEPSSEAWAWAEALHDSWCRATVRG